MDDGLSVLDLFARPVPGEDHITVAAGGVSHSPQVVGSASITIHGPSEGACGVDLSKKATDVANLLFHRFGKMIRASGYNEDDVLQEVYKGILVRNRGKGAWNPSRGKFGSYVSMVCLSVVSNFHRKESRNRHREPVGIREYSQGEWREVDVASSRTCAGTLISTDTEAGAAREGLEEHLLSCIEDGDDAMMAVSLMHMLADGYKQREIVKTLGIGTTEFHRVRQILTDHTATWNWH